MPVPVIGRKPEARFLTGLLETRFLTRLLETRFL
ncbi:hypothetical protein SPLC1_S203280 [Arthrospira platensis C1]|nr:hypothetical protein SPLC1_S203280 [Arthrospira platensis C1]